MEPSLGRTKSKPVAVVSRKAFVSAPELACEELYEFNEKLKETQPLTIEIPAPMVEKPRRAKEKIGRNQKELQAAVRKARWSCMMKEKRLKLNSQTQRGPSQKQQVPNCLKCKT